jgi:hypothetical protein
LITPNQPTNKSDQGAPLKSRKTAPLTPHTQKKRDNGVCSPINKKPKAYRAHKVTDMSQLTNISQGSILCKVLR